MPAIMTHRDIFLKDMTGSGKTFGLVAALLSKRHPTLALDNLMMDKLSTSHSLVPPSFEGQTVLDSTLSPSDSKKYISTLIMVPTRELAVQIVTWIRRFLHNVEPNSAEERSVFQSAVAGVSLEEQAAVLSQTTPSLLIGTPMRLHDLYIKNKAMDLSRLQVFLLDEADRLIDCQKRYDTVKAKFNRFRHPLAGELLLNQVARERHSIFKSMVVRQNAILTQMGDSGLNKDIEAGRPRMPRFDAAQAKPLQIIVASATANSALKNHLIAKKKIMKDPVFLDMMGKSFIPASITHKAFVVDLLGNLIPAKYEVVSSSNDSVDDGNLNDVMRDMPEVVANRTADEIKDMSTHVWADDDDQIVEAIAGIIQSQNITRAFVFGHSTVSMTRLVDRLKNLGVKADKLVNMVDYQSSTMSSGNRSSAPFESYLNGQVEVICATQYEARGLDFPDTQYVFLLGTPSSPSSYTHLAGRVGRFGKPGTVVTLLGGMPLTKKYLTMMKLLQVKLA